MKEDLTPALELLADIVQHPVFPAKEVERERKATLADLQAKTATPPQALLLRHFFGTGPYGLPVSGDAASLERIGQPDVVQFHRQAYRPEATILAAAGDVTLEELETLAQQNFGTWSATEKAEETLPALSVKREPAALAVNRPLVQASVRLALVGAPAASPDAPALLLLSHLLGGSAESRLGQNLREQKTWVYNVRSTVATFRQTGLFSIDMSVPYAVLLPALQETVHEIARLQTEPVPAAELERVKQEVATRFYFDTEDVRDIARFLAEHEAYTQGREPPDHVLDALRSVTADEIQRVARTEPGSVDVEYEGTLICFRCDLSPSPENRVRCQQEDHLPLLRREEGYTHALVGNTNTLTATLASEELHGKKIKVRGIYYPKTNQLLVEKVIPLGALTTPSACYEEV